MTKTKRQWVFGKTSTAIPKQSEPTSGRRKHPQGVHSRPLSTFQIFSFSAFQIFSPTIAIAILAIRSAMHSKIIIWLLATIVGITTILPFLLKGDGSPVGQMRIVITYPLTISFIVLALGTLWLSSGLISLEISSKEIQSIVVKPVRTFDIWLGKWLAMVAINTVLIVVTSLGLLVSINIKLNQHNDATIKQQVIIARQAIQIEPIANIEWKAEELRQRLIRQNIITETTSTAKMCGELKTARSMVAPGKSITWTIPPSSISSFSINNSSFSPPTAALSLSYKFHCNPMERTPISGTWILESMGTHTVKIPINNILDGTHNLMLPETFKPTASPIKITFNNTPYGKSLVVAPLHNQENSTQSLASPSRTLSTSNSQHSISNNQRETTNHQPRAKETANPNSSFSIQHSAFSPHTPDPNSSFIIQNSAFSQDTPDPNSSFSIQNSALSPSPQNPTIYFNPDTPVELLIHKSSFTANLIRSMLAIICFLSCIAAIGLTMSTLFSFPVAAFTTSAIIFSITLASGFSEDPVNHHHGPEQMPAKIIQLTEPAILFVKHATSNIIVNIPIENLANGMIFTWKQTAECILLLLLLIPSILALLSSILLSQKELAA